MFYETVDTQQKSRERSRARDLRASQWWKQKLALGLCHYCGQKFTPTDLTMDHKIPVARGGRSTKSNVVTCCKSCNSSKHAMTPVEMILAEK
jgi:5-methylcytosine-specific restriction enzyme A